MTDFLTLVIRHGYSVIFLLVFAEAAGMPVPAAVVLVAGGAAAATGGLRLPVLMSVAITAMLLGDWLLYFLGRYTGWALLGFLCKLSLNPETCILRSAESFYKRGRRTLVIAKFIPGVNTMAPPLAGSMKMPPEQFLALDLAGAALYASAYITLGFVFHAFVDAVLRAFQAAGHALEVVLLAAVIGYAVYRIWLYRSHRIFRLVPRVQVAELAEKLRAESPGEVILADVRSHGYYDAGSTRIPGSIRLEPNNLTEEIARLPKDKDIYVYCT